MSAEAFNGRWELLESENFDEYMKACGVGFVTRKIAVGLKPSLIFECVEGGIWKMTSESTFKTIIVEFEMGKEFDETTGDGRKVKSTFTIEGNKVIQIQKATKSGEKDSRFERYVDDNGILVIICECEGVVCKRTYKKSA